MFIIVGAKLQESGPPAVGLDTPGLDEIPTQMVTGDAFKSHVKSRCK